MSDQYPSNAEVRLWARELRPDLVTNRGGLPDYVIEAWDRTNPERPYVKEQAHHGTVGGYTNQRCRCARCSAAHAEMGRTQQRERRARAKLQSADLLVGEVR